jgi:UDP-N-acetylmuramyl pentapeptide phosphotransferase/UDP-N-acetylglucosamine-1-phosphate transferase
MSIVLALAFVLVPLVFTAALTPVALALFPRFRSRESKPRSSQVNFATRTSSRLPLVGGPVMALALLIGVGFHPDAPLWPLVPVAGFFAFGLIDDLAKTLRGRGVGEGLYFAVTVLLSLAAAILIVTREFHDLQTLTPFALATHLGTDAWLPLTIWYFVLILGTTLAAGFSDGMDGLTAGSATILMAGLWLAAGPITGVWAGLTAAGAGGALIWNLPSRWAPSARDRPRRARAYIGDSGALTLGAAMAVAAIVAGYDLLWPLIAAPLLLEGFSSLIQFKILIPLWRRLVDPRDSDGTPLPHQRFPLPLLAVPLHYHWEILGLDRRAIVLLFWVTTFLATTAGVIAVHVSSASALVLALCGAVGLAFWLSAMWLRPAFLQIEGDSVSVMHGRPAKLGPLRLHRRRDTIHDARLVQAVERADLARRPMNAYVLSQWITEIHRP